MPKPNKLYPTIGMGVVHCIAGEGDEVIERPAIVIEVPDRDKNIIDVELADGTIIAGVAPAEEPEHDKWCLPAKQRALVNSGKDPAE